MSRQLTLEGGIAKVMKTGMSKCEAGQETPEIRLWSKEAELVYKSKKVNQLTSYLKRALVEPPGEPPLSQHWADLFFQNPARQDSIIFFRECWFSHELHKSETLDSTFFIYWEPCRLCSWLLSLAQTSYLCSHAHVYQYHALWELDGPSRRNVNWNYTWNIFLGA